MSHFYWMYFSASICYFNVGKTCWKLYYNMMVVVCKRSHDTQHSYGFFSNIRTLTPQQQNRSWKVKRPEECRPLCELCMQSKAHSNTHNKQSNTPKWVVDWLVIKHTLYYTLCPEYLHFIIDMYTPHVVWTLSLLHTVKWVREKTDFLTQ